MGSFIEAEDCLTLNFYSLPSPTHATTEIETPHNQQLFSGEIGGRLSRQATIAIFLPPKGLIESRTEGRYVGNAAPRKLRNCCELTQD
jgi:hypothetical protein